MAKEIRPGQKVWDVVTEASGVVTAVCECLDGSKQACVQFEKNNGEVPPEKWFTVNRLTVVGELEL